jgi:hypothetical protein
MLAVKNVDSSISRMPFDYPKAIGALPDDRRLLFYELLAHNLTVIVRGIWSDEGIADAEKVDRMKWVNEILHRVTSKIRVLRLGEHEWTEEDSWEDIRHWVRQNPAIEGYIHAAIKWSYDYASQSEARI